MSDHITADLPLSMHDASSFDRVLFHTGEPVAVLQRWRLLLGTVSPQGWDSVKEYAPGVMNLIAEPRVLHTAALALRARGPKAPGPNKLRLETLCGDELWQMCTALGKAIKSDTYSPGEERIEWVEKVSGTGKRPIVLMDVQDRVVQKAAAMVLRPMLDPLFDPLSFAYRPARKREQAIAVAEQITKQGNFIWVTHDLKDAFCRVPVPRLLDVFYKLLPCPRLRDFLALVLPPQSATLGGIKQGGPLSSLALEVYLTHFLHLPWRQSGQPVRLIRYADDLLLTAATEDAARAADLALRELLTPAGMLLKDTFEDASRDIRTQSAEWLGYRFRLRDTELPIKLGSHAFDKLGRRFVLAHAKNRSAERAVHVLKHWVDQLGPCSRWEEPEVICGKAIEKAREYGFEESLPFEKMLEGWKEASRRWKATRKAVHKNPGYLATGPLQFPTPTSVVW